MGAWPVRADEVLASPRAWFTVSSAHGNVGSASSEEAVLSDCLDTYEWLGDDGETRSSEADDEVIETRHEGERLVLRCHNTRLDLVVTKTYSLVDGGDGLAKRVEVGPLQRRGELRVRSVVRLDPRYRDGAFYYTPRQSWTAPADRDLFGVQPAAKFTQEVVSGSGWDNRLVVAFKPGAPAVGHYRWAVRDRHVMPSAVIGSWGHRSPTALTYTPDGWSFQLCHTLEGEGAPVSATAHYLLVSGDYLDVWRHYRALPEHRAWEQEPVPAWVTRSGLGGFWHVSPGSDALQIDAAHKAAERWPDRFLPLGVFAWSLDGDYETDRPFVNETGSLIVTPEYFRTQVAAFQAHPRVKLGLYFQGALIEGRTAAYRAHPGWALQDAEGKPVNSGFRDNAAGAMYWFNPLDDGWTEHYRARLEAVCAAYDPGWIYCDGGASMELTDQRLRRPVLSDTWDRFYEAQQATVRATGPERAVLLNAQCWPHGDLYWLECSYFGADQPWRQAVEFCFDTKVLHTPQRTMLPLYWSNDDKYLALCIAFGFTPCNGGRLGAWDERVWRAIESAYGMRSASLILSSRAVTPNWRVDGGDVIAFAERVGEAVVVPLLNFGAEERVTVQVDSAEAGLPETVPARLVHPFESDADEDLGTARARDGKLGFEVVVPEGFGGLRLLVVGDVAAWPRP